MKPRILAIDDDEAWLDNYKSWIPNEMADQDSALNAKEAFDLLRKRRYELVLLDLSMDPNDSTNRDNKPTQDYLASEPEGTLYIVISGTAEKAEVRDLAFRYNAYDIIFKAEIEPSLLREKVTKALSYSRGRTSSLAVDAHRKFIPNQVTEFNIIKALDPGGAQGLYNLTNALFDNIAPLVPHKNRGSFDVSNDCVLGLGWSRKLGKAVSILLANKLKTSDEKASQELSAWLGYEHQSSSIFNLEVGNIRIKVFEEPNVSETHFDLPVIPLP